MTWSDAARKASADARRRRAKGRKAAATPPWTITGANVLRDATAAAKRQHGK